MATQTTIKCKNYEKRKINKRKRKGDNKQEEILSNYYTRFTFAYTNSYSFSHTYV